MKKKYLFLAGILLVCITAILLYPFEVTVVPAWRLRVIDEQDKPLPRVFVRQAWKHYSYESDAGDNLDDQWTDENGYVSFPRRVVKVNMLKRIMIPIQNTLSQGEHTSLGPSAAIMAWRNDNEEDIGKSVEYSPDKPLPQQLVLASNGK